MTASVSAKKDKAKKPTKKKLTLSLNEEVIRQGKALARDQGMSLSKLVEIFIKEHAPEVKEPIMVIEPDPDILALMGKPAIPPRPRNNREYYDEYYEGRRNRYLENSRIEEE
jgi:hypothetical protein